MGKIKRFSVQYCSSLFHDWQKFHTENTIVYTIACLEHDAIQGVADSGIPGVRCCQFNTQLSD